MNEKKRLKVVDVSKASDLLDDTKKSMILNAIAIGSFALSRYVFNKGGYQDMAILSNLGLTYSGTSTLLNIGAYTAFKYVIKNFDISQFENEQKEEKGRTL